MIEAIAMVGIILTLLNVWVSRRVLGDELSSETQHLAQLAFVWLVPIIGALVTIQIQRKNVERFTGGTSGSRDIADDWDAVNMRSASSSSQAADNVAPE